ncbi:acid-activated periplasmic chaperone HdeA [Hafnia paralvei]|uniref:acid-activated periplasmic chaperone HdeA n=1 Tax=Hafnia paralvei TaxID=546367 RepID=UPI00057FF396|nr:acid-activated periplasmic chaperone HdeA [Hafnia paralvei]KHS42787.1 HdeA [Hafnia paralvei]
MNKKTLLISMVCLMGFSAIGHAAENKNPVKSWTCEDFLALDESFKPTAIGFAEALNKKDKPEDAVLDVDGTEKVIPLVIEACKQNPKESFAQKVKSEWKKVKKDM